MLYITLFLSYEGKQTKFTMVVAYLDGLLLLQDGGASPNCFVLFFTPSRWEQTDLRGEPL